MTDLDWSTPDGLAAIAAHLANKIEGYVPPTAYAVGITPASSSAEIEFPHVNPPGGRHGLPAAILATILHHTSGSRTYDLAVPQLKAAVEALSPAEACTELEHPNLAAWRELLAEAASNPARSLLAVFIGDLGDPIDSNADATLRATLEGHGHVL
ncbi:MAG: hypothetical protein ABR500_08285 [Dermatophilaceae bacterium]|nr:hypothetical protein [Intrasporangiaceae bacterium]